MQESVEIRRLNISDAESLSKQANNKKIWDNLRDYIPYPYTVENAKEFIARTEKKYRAGCWPFTHWWIEEIATNNIVAGIKPDKIK